MRTPWRVAHFLLMAVFILEPIRFLSGEESGRKRKAARSNMAIRDAKMLDVNNINCYFQNDGAVGENPSTGGDGFYYPAGQRNLSIVYTGGLWFLCKVNGEIRSAVCSYSSEFQPGSILTDGRPDDPLDPKYVIFKYNKGDVVDQAAIEQGCPLEVIGDQMLFCVYNDLISHDSMWGGDSIGVEIQRTAFGYHKSVNPLQDMLFIRFRIVNRSAHDLDSAHVAMWFDPDLGNANDDYTGCDSVLHLAYVYNGDDYDERYGEAVPSMGCDLLQGPLVDSPGDSVFLPDGTVLADKKYLGMTAYFTYIGGTPLSGLNDPHTPEQGYCFVKGLKGDGMPWIDPEGNATPFPFSGDPVTGTGWLFSDLSRPKDIRMGNASGPFSMAPGDSQDVVVALVVGLGGDPLSSIQVMKQNDFFAKALYDHHFDYQSGSSQHLQPVVKAAGLDGSVVLTWDDGAVGFRELDYSFEGFNVWQGESETGPWSRIATFDIVNDVGRIRDRVYDPVLNDIVEKTVQFGDDTGLSFCMSLTEDVYTEKPIRNGTEYWYGVTAYAYSPEMVPATMETEIVPVMVVPGKPLMDTSYPAQSGDEIAVVHEGESQGNVVVRVVDPSAVTGHEYRVWFRTLASGPDSGMVAWTLTDVTLGEDRLVDQTRQGEDEAFLVVDGIQVKVSGPEPGIRDMVQVDADGNVRDSNLFRSLNYSVDRTAGKCAFLCDVAGSTEATWKARLNWDSNIFTEDYEIRFVNDPATQGDMALSAWLASAPYTMSGYQSGPVGAVAADNTYTPEYASTGGRMPFQTWMIDADGTETHVVTMILEDTEIGNWDLSGSILGPWSPQGFNYERLYGSKIPYDESEILSDGGGDMVDKQFWGMRPDNSAFSDLVISMYIDNYDINPSSNFFTEPPAPGTIIRIRTNKPNSEEDTFLFNTAGYQPVRSENIAKSRLNEINVFPNPYLGHNRAESGYFEQFVTFSNLPGECVIRIFSMSGQLVRVLEHDNGTPYERWNLLNSDDFPVASAMYIVLVRTEYGDRYLKLGVVNRKQM